MKFSLFGADIELNFWFFAVVAMFASLSRDVLAVYFVVPVIIHEAGHFAAIAANRVKIESIRFSAFGIDIKKKQGQILAPGKELTVLFAGAAANLAAAAGIYLLAHESERALLLAASNAAVAIFNLMPVGNLDGGEIARKISEYCFKPRTAFILSRAFSFIALTPLFAAAIFLILTPPRNFTLLLICAYLLIDVMVRS